MNQTEIFEQNRKLLFSIAYRMLGSASDAEDIVQEAFVRYLKAEPGEVQSPKAYLSTVVSRLCIDQLRSAQAKREVYTGPWLPEPLLTGEAENDPEAGVELADSLSLAFLILLESLGPVERAVFLLREVFDYDYREIAQVVNKSEANCRQMVRRAHHYIAERRPRLPVSPNQQERVLNQFLQTCATGDINGLMHLLTEDAMSISDGGGKVHAALNPIKGASKVARFMIGILKKTPPDMQIRLATVNYQPAIIAYTGKEPFGVLILDIEQEHIRTLYWIVNPDKLKTIPPLAD